MKKSFLLLFPFALVAYEIACYLSNDMYLPALPTFMREFNITPHTAQLTITLWFLGTATLQCFIGPISDRFGRRPVLLAGGLLYVVANAMCALIPDISIILIARYIQGVSVATMIVAGYACIHEVLQKEEAIRIVALMGSITILAPTIGPLVGAVIIHYFNWQSIFILLAVWAAIALSVLYRVMPEPIQSDNRHSLDIRDITRRFGRVLANKQFMTNLTCFCLLFMVLIAWLTAGPFLIVETFHYTPFMFGIFQALIFGAFMIGTHSVKKLIEHYSITILLIVALVWIGIGNVIAIIGMLGWGGSLSWLVAGYMCFAAGAGLSFSSFQRFAMEASQEPAGAKMSVFSMGVSWTAVFASVLISLFYHHPFRLLVIMMVVASVFTSVLRWKLVKKKPIIP